MFITPDDYKVQIREINLKRLLDTDDLDNSETLDKASRTAIAIITSYLSTRFDCPLIFAASGNDRNDMLLQHAVSIGQYYLYKLSPRTDIPQKVKDGFDDAIKELKLLRDGVGGSDLPPLLTTSGLPSTLFRLGSEPRRSLS
jgi:phage gp36-like protein